jgi:hypothetical protein
MSLSFSKFVRLMGKAVALGGAHRKARKEKASPLELITALKIPTLSARSVHVLYLREAYLAGYNFCD